ncbi:NAD-P-binding protein [Coprinellus micaceus]|uniref:NAD-P-binding protein n=1 Tax=Coprinellus micaceus TaxID=71717 RepID=A0A4Y7U1W9_COPMI|nr:NAD-P-binding protein [Coprinellus micaceus]
MPSLFFPLRAAYAFFKEAWFLGSPSWTTEDIPDLTGQVFIVTGGNSGLGKETVRALLEHNARVYLASRDEKRALAAIDELFDQTGRKARFLHLDLADFTSIKAAATEFLRKEKRLDVLFNNAGIMTTPTEVTPNGYDRVVHTNLLGPFYFTKLLLPLLISTSQARPDGQTRIVNLTSSVHHLVESLNFDAFHDGLERRARAGSSFSYCQSKFGDILFSNELSRRYKDQGVISTAVNPGNFATQLQQPQADSMLTHVVHWCLFIYPPEWGSLTQLWAGVAPDAAETSGKYVIPWGRIGQPNEATEDVELAVKLWIWLEDQVKDL